MALTNINGFEHIAERPVDPIGQRDCMLTEAFWNNLDVNPNDVPFGQHKDLVISKPEMPKEFEPTAGTTPTV